MEGRAGIPGSGCWPGGISAISGPVARGRASEEQFLLAGVFRHPGRSLELRSRFAEPADLEQQVSPDAGQEMVVFEGRLRDERVYDLQSGGWSEGHPVGDGAVQVDDRRGRELGERVIE